MWTKSKKIDYQKCYYRINIKKSKEYNKIYYETNKDKLLFRKQLRLDKNKIEDIEFLNFLNYYFFDSDLNIINNIS